MRREDMQRGLKEPPSPMVSAPRQLEPLAAPGLRHERSSITSSGDVCCSPIHVAVAAQRSSTVGIGLNTDTLISPEKRLSLAQRKRSVVHRSATRSSIVSTSSSNTRRPLTKHSSTRMRYLNTEKNQHDMDDRSGSEEEEEDDDAHDDDRNMNLFDSRMADKLYRETRAASVYEDGGKKFVGHIDRRGITPFVTFATTETPPSQVQNRLLQDVKHKPTCGFCASSNLVWVLRCAFCGCMRMSDAPRLKYLIDMILSVNPTIPAQELSKRVLEFAKFDHVAMKVEEKFKQASLVRAKAAIVMMSRTIQVLRTQTTRMIFNAWRGNNAIQARHDVIMHRLIKIKDIQVKAKSRGLAFSMWKGYVERVVEERSQRFSVASKRNDLTRVRRMWTAWHKFMRIRAKEKLQQLRAQHEAERNEAPGMLVKEIERLKKNHAESRQLVFAATNTMFDLLHQSVRFADDDIQKVLQLREMYPNTAGVFFESVYGQKILEGLSNGHIANGDDFAADDAAMDELIKSSLNDAQTKIGKMHSSESLVQWINFQRRRAARMPHSPTVEDTSTTPPTGPDQSVPSNRPSMKLKVKEKKKEIKEIKGLQDLRANISSPGVMLKLLCHMSPDAKNEYHRIRATESASILAAIAAETSTTTTALTPAAQVQLKAYFKIVPRILQLPPDVITKDAFVLNDFDLLYAYAVYLFTFHPNLIAPGLALSPRYHLSFNFLAPQWERIQNKLTDDEFDPFAQQQFYIFLAKIKRVSKQFIRFESICRAVDQIAQWHQLATLRDTYNDFTRRALGKDSNISVALEKETLASWVSLPTSKLLSLCESEDELRQIENVFKDNVLELVKIFRVYGSGSGGKGILEQEFLKVMTRAGVTDKKNILRSHLQLIYQQSRQQPSLSTSSSSTNSPASAVNTPGNGGNDDDEDDKNSEDRGATPNEFFEALVRVAHHNSQKRRVEPSAVSPGSFIPGSPVGFTGLQFSLLASVTELVVDKIIPLSKKFQEQGLMFKKQMLHPDVQCVCKAQEKRLKRVFLAYSQKNKNPGSRGKLMDLSDFETLLKDKRLVDALFPHGRIKQLIAFVQQDGDLASMGGLSGYDSDTEFVFAEFLEALAAIAVYRNANPYLPLSKKLEVFFEENF